MNAQISSIENLIARDPGQRNVFRLLVVDQLRLAALSLRMARRVTIVSGFYVPDAGAGETDGPPGAQALGDALEQLGVPVDYVTDDWNKPLFEAMGSEPIVQTEAYLNTANPSHLVAIERLGRSSDGRYRNMKGEDVTAHTAPLDELFLEAAGLGMTTIGIGDGGNEIGMGRVFAEALAAVPHGPSIATTISTDFCIAAGVSNWGAYGLTGALSVLSGRDLLPSAEAAAKLIGQVVEIGGAVDGVTLRHEATVDGLPLADSLRMLENIRRQIVPSPLTRKGRLQVGVIGYGQSGRAATALLSAHGHRVRVSDLASVVVEPGTVLSGVESGAHSIEFLKDCNLVVASPGVPADASIHNDLHRYGVPVLSELEVAYQLGDRRLVAVTGTVGKRSTVELMRKMFQAAGRQLTIGGNRGTPLSALLLDKRTSDPVAIAVSSFQLETVVEFRPHIAVMLNIDEAHLDRHRTVEEYLRIKSRIFMNHQPDDVLVLCFDDERLRPLARKHQGRTLYVSARQMVDRGAWLSGGRAFINLDGNCEELGLVNPEYPENFLAAIVVCRLSGIGPTSIIRAIGEIYQAEPAP